MLLHTPDFGQSQNTPFHAPGNVSGQAVSISSIQNRRGTNDDRAAIASLEEVPASKLALLADKSMRDAEKAVKAINHSEHHGATASIAVFNPADQKLQLRTRGDIDEPQSGAKMGLPLKIVGTVNYLLSPDARKHEVKAPDPRERLIVAGEKDKDGVLGVRKIYIGLQQPDGTIEVNRIKDTITHQDSTYKYDKSDGDDKKIALRIRQSGGSIAPSDLTALEDWRKGIEHPEISQTASAQGYSTGGPYDPNPRSNAPMGAGKPRIR